MNSSDSSSSSSRDLELIAQLRQSLGMLQVAFDAASEAMVIVDVDRRIHWANQASADLFVGGVPIQLVNQTLADVLKLRPLDAHAKAALQLLDPQRPLPRTSGESRCQVLSPQVDESQVQLLRWRPVELIQSPFLLVSFRDLSPEERALVQQQRFMTDLTHELRTPLAIVSGNLQRMARLSALPEAVSSRLTMAREEMARIQKLLGHLSLLTRLEVDPEVISCSDQLLVPLLQRWYEASRELAPSLQLKGIERGDELVVQTDPRALMLTLDQLLDNACQHANRSMPIQLSLAGCDGLDHCILEFTSQSLDAPVASEDLERWSAPFFRGKPEREGERVEGPGLGLALARELVRGCGGTLELHQQPSSQGTTTIVRLHLKLRPSNASGAVAAAVRTDPA
ncbi:two-component system sensor histidine kinase [Synechococcus sp. RS9902]|nr:two-component system sensor histidine kinase [Synechococcus sp. RS9902]